MTTEDEVNAVSNRQQCFSAIAPDSATILILGSFPGVLSLERQHYYAHPRNSFWLIMAHLLEFDPALVYQDRLEKLKEKKIALWDVLYRCKRAGSLDSAIEADSVVVNDFSTFFTQHQSIKALFFNGARAEIEFKKRVILANAAPGYDKAIDMHRLPSTSPAMASLSISRKIESWKVILRYL